MESERFAARMLGQDAGVRKNLRLDKQSPTLSCVLVNPMKSHNRRWPGFGLLFICLLLWAGPILAQTKAELHGQVVDSAGAFIVGAKVRIIDEGGQKFEAKTDARGQFRFPSIAAGTYKLTATAEGFAAFEEPRFKLDGSRSEPLIITMNIVVQEQVVVSSEDQSKVSTEPDKNLSAIVLNEEDLKAMPDDPDDLLQMLKDLAGPTASGDDASVYVDGFRERDRIPPKESIRQVRINSNPFSAEYSEPGSARIEILTRPGLDIFHTSFNFAFNDESLNARDPFAALRAPLQVRRYSATFTGPIVKKRASFFMDFERRETDNNDTVSATILDPATFDFVPFSATVLTPARLTSYTIRTNTEINKNHHLGVSYRINDRNSKNAGVGGFSLPEHGASNGNTEHQVRISETATMSNRLVNELRLQLTRQSIGSRANQPAVSIVVLDAFTGGGNPQVLSSHTENHADLTDIVSVIYKKHSFRIGGQAEAESLRDTSESNFLGTFTFSSLEQYRDVLRRVPGARPSQFSVNRGDPFSGFSLWELSWFAQDDWRVKPNLTLSLGLRHEFQTHLGDKANFAPRAGFAWSPKPKSNTVFRGGFGFFYNRLGDNQILSVQRLDGLHQEQVIIPFPAFPNPFQSGGAIVRPPTIREFAQHLNTPYSIMTTISVERSFRGGFLGSLGYTFNRGEHLFRSRNLNAPFPGTIVRPDPSLGPILGLESTSNSKRHELRLGLQRRLSKRFSLFSNYTLSRTRSDADGAFSLPANSFDTSNEWGRASFDARHQLFIGGLVNLPWKIQASPLFNYRSGRPFNITTGRDNNLDSSFTDRPSLVAPGTPGSITTRLGTFNPNPQPGDFIIPRNFGDGPSTTTASLRLSRSFGFGEARAAAFPQFGGRGPGGEGGGGRGPGGGGRGGAGGGGGGRGGFGGGGLGGGGFGGGGAAGQGGEGGGFGGNSHRYNFTISLQASNLFNKVNFGNYSGTLTSPFFGSANSAQAPRRLELQFRFYW